ncbi:MAG: polyketide synthase [Acidobacteria bacterium]|nr:MAG: polyketide synthase [Acidobacteriota bacterium]
MNSKSAPVVSQNAPNPLQIFELATGFMRAKHLFVAGELGIFEKLAEGPATFDELAAKLGTPRRTTRIVADAVTALGLLERQGDKYRNSALAQAHLSGSGGAVDMRPFLRFWNRLSYKRWLGLEDSVRQGKGVAGEFNFTPEEQKIFSEGVEAFSAGDALALASGYDFSRHMRVLDLGGGTGSFLKALLQRYPKLQCTLYELATAAAVARKRLAEDPQGQRIEIVEGDFLKDPLPKGHDVVLLAHVIHALVSESNLELLRRARQAVAPGLVVGGAGDVYSVEEARGWLDKSGWRFVELRPLGGPISLLVAEAG